MKSDSNRSSSRPVRQGLRLAALPLGCALLAASGTLAVLRAFTPSLPMRFAADPLYDVAWAIWALTALFIIGRVRPMWMIGLCRRAPIASLALYVIVVPLSSCIAIFFLGVGILPALKTREADPGLASLLKIFSFFMGDKDHPAVVPLVPVFFAFATFGVLRALFGGGDDMRRICEGLITRRPYVLYTAFFPTRTLRYGLSRKNMDFIRGYFRSSFNAATAALRVRIRPFHGPYEGKRPSCDRAEKIIRGFLDFIEKERLSVCAEERALREILRELVDDAARMSLILIYLDLQNRILKLPDDAAACDWALGSFHPKIRRILTDYTGPNAELRRIIGMIPIAAEAVSGKDKASFTAPGENAADWAGLARLHPAIVGIAVYLWVLAVRDIAALPHVISIISRSRADAGGTEGNEMEFEALLLTLWRLYDRSRRISGEAPRDFHAELEIYARPWNPEPIGVEKGWSHA